MTSETMGIIGGIGGSLIGLLGGVVGTYFSIRNAKGPEEKRLMIRASIVVWALLLFLIILPLGLAVAGVFPRWGFWPPAMVFFILIGPLIKEINKRQMAIRAAGHPNTSSRTGN